MSKGSTRNRILDAAIEVFARKGYYGAAVDDIVQASNTSKGSFYHFFPSKQGIFLSLVDTLNNQLLRRVEKAIEQERGALRKVDAALSTFVDEFSKHRRLARILLIEAAGLGHAFNEKLFEVHTQFAGLIEKHLDKAVQEGSIPPVDTAIASYVWLGAINEIVLRWLHTGEPENLQDALPKLRQLLLASIQAPNPQEVSLHEVDGRRYS